MNGRFPYHSPLFFHLFNASFHHRGHGGHRGNREKSLLGTVHDYTLNTIIGMLRYTTSVSPVSSVVNREP